MNGVNATFAGGIHSALTASLIKSGDTVFPIPDLKMVTGCAEFRNKIDRGSLVVRSVENHARSTGVILVFACDHGPNSSCGGVHRIDAGWFYVDAPKIEP